MRHSAKQLLKHDWIVENTREYLKKIEVGTITEMLKNLRKFSLANEIQQSISTVMIRLMITDQDLEILQNAFEVLDTDNEGSIKIGHLSNADRLLDQTALEKEKIEQIKKVWSEAMSGIKFAKDEKMDFFEFVTAVVDHSRVFREEGIKKAFHLLATENSNAIN